LLQAYFTLQSIDLLQSSQETIYEKVVLDKTPAQIYLKLSRGLVVLVEKVHSEGFGVHHGVVWVEEVGEGFDVATAIELDSVFFKHDLARCLALNRCERRQAYNQGAIRSILQSINTTILVSSRHNSNYGCLKIATKTANQGY